MVAVRRVALVLSVVVVVVIVVIAGRGLFNKAFSQSETILDQDLGLGSKKVNVIEKPEIPADKRAEINNLISTMGALSRSSETNCVVKYDQSALGNLRFDFLSNEVLTVYAGVGGKQEAHDNEFKIEGVNLCVVAGDGAENFYYNFLKSPSQNKGKTYQSVGRVVIFQEEGEHKIIFNGIKADLPKANWLFKGESNDVCFLPAMEGAFDQFSFKYNEEGLHPSLVPLAGTLRDCEVS